MQVALFVPCYINELFWEVAEASKKLLEKFEVKVTIPKEQTCCGQPIINSGYESFLPYRFDKVFSSFEYVVAPSSSCVSTIRQKRILTSCRVFELTEFLYYKLKLRGLAKNYPRKIALHNSCHAIRHLRLSSSSELVQKEFNIVKEVLGKEVFVAKRDECCGFGGVFTLKEGFLSYIMGKDKLNDLLTFKPDVICGVDMSCLYHLKQIAQKEGISVEIKHIANLLWEAVS